MPFTGECKASENEVDSASDSEHRFIPDRHSKHITNRANFLAKTEKEQNEIRDHDPRAAKAAAAFMLLVTAASTASEDSTGPRPDQIVLDEDKQSQLSHKESDYDEPIRREQVCEEVSEIRLKTAKHIDEKSIHEGDNQVSRTSQNKGKDTSDGFKRKHFVEQCSTQLSQVPHNKFSISSAQLTSNTTSDDDQSEIKATSACSKSKLNQEQAINSGYSPSLERALSESSPKSKPKSPRSPSLESVIEKPLGLTRFFPLQLFTALSSEPLSKASLALEWMPSGEAWRILRWEALEEILPLYFPQCGDNLDIFLDLVDTWGFKKLLPASAKKSFRNSADQSCFFHEYFFRDIPELCRRMKPLPPSMIAQNSNTGYLRLAESDDRRSVNPYYGDLERVRKIQYSTIHAEDRVHVTKNHLVDSHRIVGHPSAEETLALIPPPRPIRLPLSGGPQGFLEFACPGTGLNARRRVELVDPHECVRLDHTVDAHLQFRHHWVDEGRLPLEYYHTNRARAIEHSRAFKVTESPFYVKSGHCFPGESSNPSSKLVHLKRGPSSYNEQESCPTRPGFFFHVRHPREEHLASVKVSHTPGVNTPKRQRLNLQSGEIRPTHFYEYTTNKHPATVVTPSPSGLRSNRGGKVHTLRNLTPKSELKQTQDQQNSDGKTVTMSRRGGRATSPAVFRRATHGQYDQYYPGREDIVRTFSKDFYSEITSTSNSSSAQDSQRDDPYLAAFCLSRRANEKKNAQL